MKYRLDEVDRTILAGLRENGRATLRSLAEATGRTSMAVKKRLDRMKSQGLLKIYATLNTSLMRLRLLLVHLEMENHQAQEKVIRRFKDCPRLIFLFSLLGDYNMAALMFAEDQATLESILAQRCSIRSGPWIRRSQVSLVTRVDYATHLPIRIEHVTKNRQISPCGARCRSCPRYLNNNCLACPATRYYRGPL